VADFTNPLTRKWWFGKRRYLIEDIGVDGFKTDGGECIYGDVVFHDGRNGREMRNRYPNEYIGAYYSFARELTGGDAVTFSRAGYAGAQNWPMHWAGDERSTFEAFRSSVIAGLSSGMSGLPFWGWDLAGFHGDIPTAELYVRSAQMAAFCPVMQYHAESKGEFNQDRTPWNVAERTGKPWVLTLYKRYADLRMNLLPYIYDQAVRTSRTGIPLMRAMAFAYPDDPRCARLKEQYMFGDALLVAPVVEEGRTVKDVYLPEGLWLPLFGGDAVPGGRMVRVEAAIGDIPVFQRQDSVVAWNLPADYALPGDVGNRVDGYVNLTFSLFVRERLDETFEDDLGSRVRIRAERTPYGLHVRLDGRCAAPVTVVLRDVPGVRSVTDGASRELRRDEAPHAMRPGGYAARGHDLYVKTDACAGEWRILFA
jgi:alpha-glucosidase (family GH31 glycosyl hydrolase)